MPQDPLIGHLHSENTELRRIASKLTHDQQQYRDCVSAIKAAIRNSDAPIAPAFIRSTLHAYGLGDS